MLKNATTKFVYQAGLVRHHHKRQSLKKIFIEKETF